MSRAIPEIHPISRLCRGGIKHSRIAMNIDQEVSIVVRESLDTARIGLELEGRVAEEAVGVENPIWLRHCS